eukprot:m.355933 g.355933  ORF g.355933 m.355933 type:complete len:1205 (+) comp20741_c0_seq3:245-3859(+)
MNNGPRTYRDRDDQLERSRRKHEESQRRFNESRRERVTTSQYDAKTSSLHTSRVQFDERQKLRSDEMANSRMRMSLADQHIGASRINDNIGSAKGSVREIEEMEMILSERLKRVEETSRAIAGAADSVDTDAMLARARGEAEAWKKGNATTNRLASQMSAVEVHALVAERNELRVQVRNASAQLHKIKLAAGGDPVDLVRFCQQDMERMATLRAAVEHEHESLKIKLVSTREELEDAQRQNKSYKARVGTSEEQLAERAEAIVELNQQLEQAKLDLEQTKVKCEQTIHDAIRKQHEQLLDEHARDKEAMGQRLHEAFEQRTREALGQLRTELEQAHDNRMQEKLSEQHHVIVAQKNQERVEELEALQRELNDRESRNVEALRTEMQSERERAVAALEQRLRTVENRAARDLEEHRETHQMQLEQMLDEQKQALLSDARAEKRSALEKLEATLTRKHRDELAEVREHTAKKHKDELAATVKRTQEQLRKKLEHDHAQDKNLALRTQAKELTDDKNTALKALTDSLQRRHQAECKTLVEQTQDATTKKIERAQARKRAQEVEQVKTEAKRDKTKALEAMRTKVIEQHGGDLRELKHKYSQAQEELQLLRRDAVAKTETANKQLRKTKTEALDALRQRMTQQHEADVAELRQKLAAAQEDLQQMHRDAVAKTEQANAELRKAKTRALDTQRERMKQQHDKDMEELRATNAALVDERDRLRIDKTQALEKLHAEYRADKLHATDTLRARKDQQLVEDTASLKAQVAELSERLRRFKEDRAKDFEKLTADFRVEKTTELDGLRDRMEEQRNKDFADLREQIGRLTDENRRLDVALHKATGEEHTRAAHNKHASTSLRDVLRKLLSDMKAALLPRANAPLDTSVSSPSQAMGALHVLVKCLGLRTPDFSTLAEPSREAVQAPLVSVDILLACANELCGHLNACNEEINNLHIEVGRDWKLLQKQIRDDVQDEYDSKLQRVQQSMSRQVDAAVHTKAAEMARTHTREIGEHRAAMEDEMRTFKMTLATRKQKRQQDLKDHLDSTVATLDARQRSSEEQSMAMMEALVSESDALRRDMHSREDELFRATQENDALRAELEHLQRTHDNEVAALHQALSEQEHDATRFTPHDTRGGSDIGRAASHVTSNSSFSASPSVTPKPSYASTEPPAAYDGRLFEMERMRLELRISHLQTALENAMALPPVSPSPPRPL